MAKKRKTKKKTTRRKTTKKKATRRKKKATPKRKKKKTTKRKKKKATKRKKKTAKRKKSTATRRKKKTTKRKKKTARRAASKKVDPIPKGWNTVTAQLVVHDATRAIDFYKKALNAKVGEVYNTPDGKIIHAELKVGDSKIMLSDEMPPMPNMPGVYQSPKSAGLSTGALFLYVRNADKAFDAAVKAGCSIRQPITNQFWGDRYGQVIDPFGHTWAFATRKEKVSKKELARRQEEMFRQMAATSDSTVVTQTQPASEPAAQVQPRNTEPDNIEHELTVNATPEVIYDAITQPDGLQGWWARNSQIETNVGGTNTLHFDKDGTTVTMKFRIANLVPDSKVVWECIENGNPIWVGTKLQWEIQGNGGDAKVVFSHEGFRQGGPAYQLTKETWPHFLNSLKAYLESGQGQPSA